MTHPLFLTKFPTKPLQTPRHCYPYLSYIDLDTIQSYMNLDTTFYALALVFFRAKILHVLQSQVGLQKKTTYRLMLFLSNSNKARDILQIKATKKVTSKVVREMTGWTQRDLSLGMLILALTRSFLYGRDLHFLYGRGLFFCMVKTVKSVDVSLDNPRGLRK